MRIIEGRYNLIARADLYVRVENDDGSSRVAAILKGWKSYRGRINTSTKPISVPVPDPGFPEDTIVLLPETQAQALLGLGQTYVS